MLSSVARADARGGERLATDGDGRREDLIRVVLDVPRRWIALGDLTVRGAADGPGRVEHERR